jgi:hypothetical protein
VTEVEVPTTGHPNVTQHHVMALVGHRVVVEYPVPETPEGQEHQLLAAIAECERDAERQAIERCKECWRYPGRRSIVRSVSGPDVFRIVVYTRQSSQLSGSGVEARSR